jgi:hypothetical protein
LVLLGLVFLMFGLGLIISLTALEERLARQGKTRESFGAHPLRL